MKYYAQYYVDDKIVFDVLWGEALEADKSLALCKDSNKWSIIDIESGLFVVKGLKSKKEALEWYDFNRNTTHLCARIKGARKSKKYAERVAILRKHKIFKTGDKVTYIDVKDSIILELDTYSPSKDKWIAKNEFFHFEVSPDRIIKHTEIVEHGRH